MTDHPSKESSKWFSSRLGQEIQLVRWGSGGRPLLIFPTAAGDAEECERFHLIAAIGSFVREGKVRAYSMDSVAGQSWADKGTNLPQAASMQDRFDACLIHEIVPAVRTDCGDGQAEIAVTGASIGAFNALAALGRHPDVFSEAICMSGSYDLPKLLKKTGRETDEYLRSSPLHFLPKCSGEALELLRKRFVLLAHGNGPYESPEECWRVAAVLGKLGVPNRVDEWGKDYRHDWTTWREMLPRYLGEMLV
jgi:esterase/lipase superfamily enzyme